MNDASFYQAKSSQVKLPLNKPVIIVLLLHNWYKWTTKASKKHYKQPNRCI